MAGRCAKRLLMRIGLRALLLRGGAIGTSGCDVEDFSNLTLQTRLAPIMVPDARRLWKAVASKSKRTRKVSGQKSTGPFSPSPLPRLAAKMERQWTDTLCRAGSSPGLLFFVPMRMLGCSAPRGRSRWQEVALGSRHASVVRCLPNAYVRTSSLPSCDLCRPRQMDDVGLRGW